MADYQGRWQTVDVKVDQGIAWVTFNRPEKRNAMSPTLNSEMIQVLEALELDADAKVLVLGTGGLSHQLDGERAGLVDVPAGPERQRHGDAAHPRCFGPGPDPVLRAGRVR